MDIKKLVEGLTAEQKAEMLKAMGQGDKPVYPRVVNTKDYGQIVELGYVNGKPFSLGRGKCRIILNAIDLIKTVSESPEIAKTDKNTKAIYSIIAKYMK